MDEGVDDLGRDMGAGLGVLVEQTVSVAELKQVAVGPHQARPGRCFQAGGGAARPKALRRDAGLHPDFALGSRPVAWRNGSDFLSHGSLPCGELGWCRILNEVGDHLAE